jgi:ABC-type polysaccharide/polyol phosphate transport system ATPase subunit
MSDNIAIQVKNVTKVYHLYDKSQDRFKEVLHPFRKSYHHDFFAINDISFEIKKGETVGIIGKNGAGKSTLLKMITGVLTPTSGDIQVNGKIASLLELGAGFNPEMTGLENIYLNGTLMGFSQQEMEPKIEAILEFADIGEFIHQPVKVYSSGMFARLAFSVAINVEPDILIVDEALSVGDARFQSKCIRKMEELAEKRITILFVTHDMQSVNKFCKELVWLQDGAINQMGEPAKIIENYVSFMAYGLETAREIPQENKPETKQKTKELKLIDTSDLDSFGEKKAMITGAIFVDKNGKPTSLLKQGDYVSFICEFSTSIELHDVGVGVLFKDILNNDILTFNSYMYDVPISTIKEGITTTATIKFKVPKLFPKEYVIAGALSEGTQKDHIQQHWIHELTTVNIISKDHIDGSLLSLYPDEIEYSYE